MTSLRFTPAAQVTGFHAGGCYHAGAGYRRQYCDFHLARSGTAFGRCRSVIPSNWCACAITGESPGHTNTYGGDDNDFFSYPMYRDLRDKNGVFNGLLANDQQTVGVQWNNRSDITEVELVSGNYFQVLGLRPAIGRPLLPSDDQPNSKPVVVLSFNYWKTKLGADPSVIGQTLLINAHPFTIVGIAPPGFHSVVAGETPGVFVTSSKRT